MANIEMKEEKYSYTRDVVSLDGNSRNSGPVPSLLAGEEVKENGTIGHHHQRIMDVMSLLWRTNAQIADRCGLDRISVTRRVTELERRGLIERGPVIKCPILGRKAGTWRLTI